MQLVPDLMMQEAVLVAVLPLSSFLRLVWEGVSPIGVAETIIVFLFGILGSHGLLAGIVVPLTFLVIAYFDTFLEYRDYSKDLREQQAIDDKLNSR